MDVADDADDAAVALAATVFADAGGDDLVAFDDFADWYTDGGYKVASWLETEPLEVGPLRPRPPPLQTERLRHFYAGGSSSSWTLTGASAGRAQTIRMMQQYARMIGEENERIACGLGRASPRARLLEITHRLPAQRTTQPEKNKRGGFNGPQSQPRRRRVYVHLRDLVDGDREEPRHQQRHRINAVA